jgi:hypothetical protein
MLSLLGLSFLGQGDGAAPAAYMSAAEIGKSLAATIADDPAAGAAVTISPGIAVRRRSGSGEPQYAIVHPFSPSRMTQELLPTPF